MDIIRVLGIETSCDETAAAIVENGREILASKVASQIDLHSQYGGIFPEVASRQHVISIHPIVDDTLSSAHVTISEVDAIAITRGPGLPGSLVVGVNFAKGLSLGTGLPIIGINHLEAHLYSAWLYDSLDVEEPPPEPKFPLLGLIVSGGHTELILMKEHLCYERLGGTLDDAAGEAFDKVGRLLGLPYPGGPAIQEAAKESRDLYIHEFPRAWLEGTWDFSFSGLKTAVLQEVQNLKQQNRMIPVEDIAARFQESVVDVLVTKTIRAAKNLRWKKLLLQVESLQINFFVRRCYLKLKFPFIFPILIYVRIMQL
jgi:N6-L-threonylcarbamoyladenine synthase